MKCRYRDCFRDAHKGWTTCARHHSAGNSIKNQARKIAARKKGQKRA